MAILARWFNFFIKKIFHLLTTFHFMRLNPFLIISIFLSQHNSATDKIIKLKEEMGLFVDILLLDILFEKTSIGNLILVNR